MTGPPAPADRPRRRTRPAATAPPRGRVVLVHGTLDSSASFRRVMDHLPAWELITYDRRGWGASAAFGPSDVAGHAEDLAAVLAAHGPAIVAGHSFGASVALTVAAAEPALVRAVVAYEPPLPWLPWWPDLAEWERLVLGNGSEPPGSEPPGKEQAAENLLRGVLGDRGWERLPERVRAQRRAEGAVLTAEMRSLREGEPSFDPEDVRSPVVTAAGAGSLAHHRLTARRLAELVPRGAYHELAGAEHPGHVTHPAAFAQLVEAAADLSPGSEAAVMTPEEFRRHGHDLVDWVADYLSTVEKHPVLSPVEPGWVRAQLPASAPEQPEPFGAVLADLDRVIVPGLTHWQSPNFFAYFPANNSGPSILGELAAAGFGVQGMLWQTSPACTELETHVLDWMVELLGLPSAFRSDSTGGGVIQDSASSAALCALLAARERATGGQSNVVGVRTPLVAYTTAEAHSSIEKAVRIAGLGEENLRRVGTEADASMSPSALEAAIRADLDAGRQPCFVSATVGTTATNAMDPIPAIAEVCQRYGVWLHVDAAMSGSAAICPEFRHLQAGLDGADSYCMNPHKWLLTNFDCDCFFVRDRAALIGALSILPEYLRNAASASGAVIDYRDWQVPLGRRFRSLKLWFVLRSYGAQGLRAMVRRHVAATRWLAGAIEASSRFELAAPSPLNLVCFAHVDGDAATRAVLDAVNGSGQAYLTHAKVGGRLVIRVCVGQEHTELRHVQALWSRLTAAA